jgi:MFS family permease
VAEIVSTRAEPRSRSTAAFFVVGGSWFVTMAGANLATPLYAVYEQRFGFSSAALTVVFATYMLVLAPSLLVFGQLSDRLGRRRVMAAGLVTATAGGGGGGRAGRGPAGEC